jgi:hypothetical protein
VKQIRHQNQETGALLEPNTKRTMQEIVRETFTPTRVGLLSWAFAAVLMGTVGVASYQFGSGAIEMETSSGTGLLASGVALPPVGDIETTSSIGVRGQRPSIAIMNLPVNRANRASTEINQSQIEVMQKEIVGLRRRLMDLSEQNGIYSKRIAALEKEVAVSKLAGLNGSGPANVPVKGAIAEPVPGVVRTNSGPVVTEPVVAQPETDNPPFVVSRKPMTRELRLPSAQQTTETPPRLISIYQDNRSVDPGEEFSSVIREPVRIVTLPQPETDPGADEQSVVTGSIPTSTADTQPEVFDTTPTRTTLEPKIITPSNAVGRLRSGSDSQLKRSDFGAVIGHYRSTASAAKAWADFKEQNEERMRDLRPLLLERQVPEGGISLLVGPFGNAADAAVACFHLLDVTELCHPALYAGDPLITAAKFRDSAFQN